MAQKKRRKPKEYTDDSLHIDYPWSTSPDSFVKMSLTLKPVTSISVYGTNPTFEWEGTIGKDIIKVSLARQVNEKAAVITGNFPFEIDQDRGSTYDQLYDELRRVLGKLS